ncbi:terminase small subunit [Allofustis seminis]|uniref:terminase small subunit n=1 Tax=Allofustis seminis TaxID=166939 RepID=UPI00036DE524|nr:terminase small subunit [Allofustis seminis]
MSKLTARQKRFADEYIITGNITQAAINAGYSKKYADRQGYRLLGIVGMQDYIEERNKLLDAEKIADMQEVKEFWTNVVRDDENTLNERIKASELIAKTYGAFLDQVEQTGDVDIRIEWADND